MAAASGSGKNILHRDTLVTHVFLRYRSTYTPHSGLSTVMFNPICPSCCCKTRATSSKIGSRVVLINVKSNPFG